MIGGPADIIARLNCSFVCFLVERPAIRRVLIFFCKTALFEMQVQECG